MEEKNIIKILQIILENLSNPDFTWRLEGSANLKIQGVITKVNDLDITTNDKGINIFRDSLKEFILKDFYNEKLKGFSLICNINNFEVEINSYGDRELDMFDKTKIVTWNNIDVPILPLEYAYEFYKKINRKEKVELISKYLKRFK